MSNSPCFDVATRTDCHNRSESCRLNCPKWAKYVKERDKEYEQRRAEMPAKAAFLDMSDKRYKGMQKYRIHQRSTRGNGGSYKD